MNKCSLKLCLSYKEGLKGVRIYPSESTLTYQVKWIGMNSYALYLSIVLKRSLGVTVSQNPFHLNLIYLKKEIQNELLCFAT